MTECPHGGDPHCCPPCQDGHRGRRLPAWQLVRRKRARYGGLCGDPRCRAHLEPGDYVAFWTDANDDESGLKSTCALCHPDGVQEVPELEQVRGHRPPCPACGCSLTFDDRTVWRNGRMRLIDNPRPPRCAVCRYVHQEAACG